MKIKIKGLKLNYKIDGLGSPVVILHGWGEDSNTVKNLTDMFSLTNTVYTLDLPGFGLSETPDKSWDIYDYEDCVTKFIQAMNLENVILVGHSMGGAIAICLAYSRLVSIKALFLVSAAGVRNKPGKKSIINKLKVILYKVVRGLIKILPLVAKKKEKLLNKLQRMTASEDYINAKGVMRNTFVKVLNNDLQYAMAKVVQPSVLIWGDLDTATPLDEAQIMNGLIRNSKLKIVRGTGHFPFLDNPNEVYEIISKELRRINSL
ncbi:MAG: alpha/beta hydrolase [Clostridia bacterium]|nr:alpha/beta hydrolase [Clostridia bacterium]